MNHFEGALSLPAVGGGSCRWVVILVDLASVFVGGWVYIEMFTSGGGLDDDPSDEMLAPSRLAVMPSKSHSDVVSESLSRDVVLGGDK